VDGDQIFELFLVLSGVYDKIYVHTPIDGFYGDFKKLDDTFQDALYDSILFFDDDLNEGMKDILKPKNEDDVKTAFKKLPLYKKIEFLYDNKMDIPKEYLPLIWTEKEKLKKDPKFDNYFRVTSTNPISYTSTSDHVWSVVEVDPVGVYFRIYARKPDDSIPFIIVEQMNDEDYLRAYIKNSENKKGKIHYFKTAEDLFEWMLKAGYKQYTEVSEALQNIFKPKDISDLSKMDSTQLFKAHWKELGLNIKDSKKPLIFELDDKAEKYWKNCGDFDTFDKKGRSPWTAHYEGYDIGVHFFILEGSITFRVWQNDGEQFAWVGFTAPPDYKLKNKQKIYSFEELKEYVENVVA
jgi:hypothetical protein